MEKEGRYFKRVPALMTGGRRKGPKLPFAFKKKKGDHGTPAPDIEKKKWPMTMPRGGGEGRD